MHGSIGSSCAVADVQGGKATIWSATQAVYPLKSSAAMLLGLQPENVHVIFRMGPGCYGCNGADTVSYDAALLSQAVGKPVRVQLTRKDEMAWENYGFAFVIDRARRARRRRHDRRLGSRIVVADAGRPARERTTRAMSSPASRRVRAAAFAPRTPAPDPTAFANNSNAVPSYVTGCVAGRCGGTGTVASQRVLTHNVQSPFFTGPLRSPERLQNTFAHESFMDEIAAAVKADPVEYRLRHLSDPRLIDVVKAAAKGGELGDAAVTAAGRSAGPASRRAAAFRACCTKATTATARWWPKSTSIRTPAASTVKRLVIANDCGPISNPDGLRNQLEGGALQGMSRALLEEVTWDDQKVTSIDWRTYRPLYLGADVPTIETVLHQPTRRAGHGRGRNRGHRRRRRRSPTPSSTPPARASARRRSRPNG